MVNQTQGIGFVLMGKGKTMGEMFKYFGIAITVIIADALFCMFLSFLYDDSDKWLPAFVLNFVGFVACLTILIAKVV